jgi:hypothetical protein
MYPGEIANTDPDDPTFHGREGASRQFCANDEVANRRAYRFA